MEGFFLFSIKKLLLRWKNLAQNSQNLVNSANLVFKQQYL